MTSPDVVNHIVSELSHGVSEADIRHSLSSVGWKDADIDESLVLAHQKSAIPGNAVMAETKAKSDFMRKNSKVFVALAIGGLLVLAGSAFAGYQYVIQSPAKIMQKATTNFKEVKSFSFSGKMTANVDSSSDVLNLQTFFEKFNPDDRVAGASSDTDFSFDFNGTVDAIDENHPKGKVDLKLHASIMNVTMKMLYLEGVAYFRLENVPKVSDDVSKYTDTWIKVDPGSLSKQYGVGLDFENGKLELTDNQKTQIQQLTENAKFYKSIKKLANDSIDGASMYHYAIELDKNAIVDYITQVNKIQQPDFSASDMIKEALDSANFSDVEVWVGKSDKLIHRFSMSISEQRSSSTPSGSVGLVMNFSDFNKPAIITAPNDYKKLEDLIGEAMRHD